MRSSTSSGSLTPPTAKILMPLSSAGLCEAEIMTPKSARTSLIRKAAAGVGTTPASSTSTPELESPAATAAEMNSPEMRGSRARTATGRRPDALRPSATRPCPRTTAADCASPRASSTVRSWLARPRTPSVPKRRAISFVVTTRELTLRELRSLAGLLETGLLALDDAGVTGEEASLLEGRTVVLAVDLVERARDREAQRAGLARGAAAADASDHVVGAREAEQREGVGDELLVQLVGEVLRELTAVDREGALAGDQARAGDSLLATTDSGTGDAGDRALGDDLGLGRGLGGVVLNVFSHELVLKAAALTGRPGRKCTSGASERRGGARHPCTPSASPAGCDRGCSSEACRERPSPRREPGCSRAARCS